MATSIFVAKSGMLNNSTQALLLGVSLRSGLVIEILRAYKLEFTDKQIKQFVEDNFSNALNEIEKQEMLTIKYEELTLVVGFAVHILNAHVQYLDRRYVLLGGLLLAV